MTTKQAAAQYLGEHLSQWATKAYAVYNPQDLPLEDLPVIFGFNNGGQAGWFSGCLMAQDGTVLGGHICSHEDYMPHDLGILEGARPDRHEAFKKHYPDGYRMDFVSYGDAEENVALQHAFTLHEERSTKDEQPVSE